MSRRARFALTGAVCGLLAMALTWFGAHEVGALRRVDANVLIGFLELRRPALWVPANEIAKLCNPFPYVLLAAVPIAIALLRGRPRLALAIFVLILGANASVEMLKPLLAGPRDAVPGVALTNATWPSGHATAAMSLALAMVIGAPSRLRPAVGALMAVFVVAVVYSFLTLGWHYPSDVLGGFELSSTWACATVAGLSLWEARRPAPVRARQAMRRFTLAGALAPSLALLVGGLVALAALAVIHPHSAVAYATAHPAFIAGAAAIALLSFGCAAGLNLLLAPGADGLSGSGPAPTAARRARSLPG